jgi:hypothetical protein
MAGWKNAMCVLLSEKHPTEKLPSEIGSSKNIAVPYKQCFAH